MAKSYPTGTSQLYDGNFNQWALEGLELSKTTVYPGKLRESKRLNFNDTLL
jgi:hypothetical protein